MVEQSDTARPVRRSGAGICVPSEFPKHLAEAILALRSALSARQDMGQRGRAYALRYHSPAAAESVAKDLPPTEMIAPSIFSFSDFAIRAMKDADIPQVVETHLESFPGFFLSSLGHRFLALFYKGVLTDPYGIALVVCSQERVLGFVVGVIDQRDFYSNLIRRQWWEFGLAASSAVLRRPSIIPRLMRALKQPDVVSESCAAACLMSIAVRPEMQTQGLGRMLVEAFSAEARRRGVKSYCLTTDRNNNEKVNHFYQKLGFKIGRVFITPEGRAMNEYVISLEE